jgi:hypothetical protein
MFRNKKSVSTILSVQRHVKEIRITVKIRRRTVWTNSMFGECLLILYPHNISNLLRSYYVFTLNEFRPANFVFLYLIGAYIALLLLGINPWLSLPGQSHMPSHLIFSSLYRPVMFGVLALGYMPLL